MNYFVYPGDDNDPIEHYSKIQTALRNECSHDEYNNAERIFINSTNDVMPEDATGLTPDEYTYWDATLGFPYYAMNLMFGWLGEKFDSTHDATYGYELRDAQSKQHSYAAIGLMMGQYLGLMYKSKSTDNPEVAQLVRRMYEDIKFLTTHDDVISQTSPFAVFQEKSLENIQQGALSGYDASKPEGLAQARKAIETYQSISSDKATDLNKEFTSLSEHYTKSLSEINRSIAKGELNDPASICVYLHKLRLDLTKFSKSKVKKYRDDRISASNQLFDAAKQLSKGNAVSNPDLRAQANELLEGLRNAGELNSKVTGDSIISGDSKPAPVITINDDTADIDIDWDALKKKEADRINAVLDEQNKELDNKLRNLSEKYYNEINQSINAASHIKNLQGEQLLYAIDNQTSTAEAGEVGSLSTDGSGKPIPSVSLLTKVIHKGYKEKDPETGKLEHHKGIQGPAWNIIFDPSDPDNADSLKGTYTANFTKHSDVAKQQAITDQASLIALSNKSVHFTAACYGKKGSGRVYDKQATIEMAIMQAIAIQNTSGLSLEDSKIRILMGYAKDDNDKQIEVYSDYMTVDELLAFGGPKDASKDASEAKRLDINVGRYFYPDTPGKYYGTNSGTGLYYAYQRAKKEREANDAGMDFIKQDKDADLDNFAPRAPDLTGDAATKGANQRKYTRETLVLNQATKTMTEEYKERMADFKANAEPDDIADASIVGKPGGIPSN